MLSRRQIKFTLQSNSQIPSYTHPNYSEISSKLSKLGNMRVEILTLNFSIKNGLEIVSKTKMKNCWSTIDQGLHCA